VAPVFTLETDACGCPETENLDLQIICRACGFGLNYITKTLDFGGRKCGLGFFPKLVYTFANY
jgi:hypothetical protein